MSPGPEEAGPGSVWSQILCVLLHTAHQVDLLNLLMLRKAVCALNLHVVLDLANSDLLSHADTHQHTKHLTLLISVES